MKQLTEEEALNKAAAYCTLCERCTYEVTSKLTAWGIEKNAQQRITDWLIKEKFIDESRYCRAFVNDKLRFNHWGRIKIKAALREKHLPARLIEEALQQIDEDEYINILRSTIAVKRRETGSKDEYTAMQKIVRFTASRGFEPSLIMKQLNTDVDEVDL